MRGLTAVRSTGMDHTVAKKENPRRTGKKQPVGDKSPRTGPRKKMGPRDVPKHTCVPEVERSVMEPGKPKVIHYRCRTCHVSMGHT